MQIPNLLLTAMVEASYTNHYHGIEFGCTMASSFGTFHDLDTILASTLSMIKIKYQGCVEYTISYAFSISALLLDPHTQWYPTYQGPKLDMTPQIKQLGSITIVTKGTLDREETNPNISTWLYREPPIKNKELLDHFKQKYPWSHHLATKQWDYHDGGLGH